MQTQKIKTQKLIKVGNSYAVTLDREFVSQSGLDKKKDVTVQYNISEPSVHLLLRDKPEVGYTTSERKLTKSEKSAYLASEITPEFKKWVDKTLEEDRKSMKALAHL
ncbi:MAG: hypothetical protein HZA34_02640 [Candidatus Pacebacteria bacterium]|nr:hypothetical protein [Candidatus Paceibacterota bacterium]